MAVFSTTLLTKQKKLKYALTKVSEGSRENRLPFFYANRQKGATIHDKTKRENPRGADRRNRGRKEENPAV